MTDRKTVYTVVVLIGLLAFVLYGAAVSLLHAGREVPDALWLAAGNISGVLGALLASTRSSPTVTPETVPPPAEPTH